MRVKISTKLPGDSLRRPDRVEREARDRNDIEIIDRHATRLNREAIDTLEYQRLP